MRRILLVFLAALIGLPFAGPLDADEHAPPGLFASWEPEVFAKAKRERRILLVMVSTSWCHWCHVMKRTTYKDPRVRRLLDQRFQPILVDADARPDLAERFRNYRWPATAFLTSAGEPILAIRGHRYANDFLRLLQDVVRRTERGGPYPGFTEPHRAGGEPPGQSPEALRRLRTQLIGALDRHYDPVHAGWGTGQKYPVPEPVLWGLRQTPSGRAARRSLATLRAMDPLLDRAWGGVYQYSVGPGWDRWHPEKIISVNAGALHNYLAAHRRTGDAGWLKRALTTARWFTEVLALKHGGFFASQDADSPDMKGEKLYRLPRAERERYRRPRVDRHVYARENGWIVTALLDLFQTTQDPALLTASRRTLIRVFLEHRDFDGLLLHEVGDASKRRFVMDQIAVAQAAVALHQVTGKALWLTGAVELAKRADRRFRVPDGGGLQEVIGEAGAPGALGTPLVSLETGAAAARLFVQLGALDATHPWRKRAAEIVAAVGSPRQIKAHWRHVGGLLLAVDALLQPTIRIEVVVDPETPEASRAMLEAARGLARDRPDVLWTQREPGTGEATGVAFLCGDGTCSDPVTEPLGLELALAAFEKGS